MNAEFPCPHCGKPIRVIGSDTTPAHGDLRDMRVEDLPIRDRQALILGVLKRKGIKTIRELIECTVDDFVDIPGFGETSLGKLLSALEKLGLTLKGLEQEEYSYGLFRARRFASKWR